MVSFVYVMFSVKNEYCVIQYNILNILQSEYFVYR